MNPIRIVLAALLGGVIVFGWGYVSHMLLPTGDMGVKSLPAEEVVVPVLKTSIAEPGFYLFPGMTSKKPSDAEQKAWEEKYKTGPHGVLVIHPKGEEFNFLWKLATEGVSNILAALMAAVVLAAAGGGVGRGLGLGLALGLFAWLSIDVSYWNWYGFPKETAIAGLIDQAVGWLLAGAAMGAMLCRGKAPAAAAV